MIKSSKLKTSKNLSKICSNLRKKGKKIVLCHGVFDLLHIGHLKHFEEAKKNGDILIVSLTKDEFIKKGFNRPVFKLDDRLFSISSLQSVDYVIESPAANATKIIQILKPDFYVKGPDYKNFKNDITNQIKLEKNAIKKIGGKLIFTKTPVKSSTKLLFDNDMIFNKHQKKFLYKVSKSIKHESIEKIIKKIKSLKVLIVGETIIDKYSFCETVGKASKDPMLVVREKEDKIFLGGAASIAQNVRKICKNVSFLSEVGKSNLYTSFIKSKLYNVQTKLIKNQQKDTIEKKRYIDEVSNSKLLGVYNVEDNKNFIGNRVVINKYLKKNLKKFDLVIVSDYGHGLLDLISAKLIIKNSKFLFLNCQINANNKGTHSIKKYKGASNLIINETELRYEMRDNISKTEILIKKFANDYNLGLIIVTRGINGSIIYIKKKREMIKIPAFSNTIIDKVGTGDIMLSIISLFFAVTNNYQIGILAGSMFASKSLKKFGNENVLNLPELSKFFSTFLK